MLAAVAASCSRDIEIAPDPGEPLDAVLRLSTTSVSSRGDSHFGDDPYGEESSARQEEKINRVNLFFFESAESGKPAFFSYELTKLGKTTYADITVKVPVELTGNFKDNKAYVYALVNLPGNVAPENAGGGGGATLEQLRQLQVTEKGFAANGVPADFVMRGGAEVKLDGSGKDALISGWIPLERLASKIRLFAGIEDVIYLDVNGKTLYKSDDESQQEWEERRARQTVETWVSEPVNNETQETNVRLYMYNIATKGRINGDVVADPGYEDVDRRKETADAARKLDTGVSLSDYDEAGDSGMRGKYPWTHADAYYSYPNKWENGDSAGENRTYVILSVPWRRQDNGDGLGEIFQTCYYQIPVNAIKGTGKDKDRLDPNTYYRIKISIGMLGSKDLGSPLEIEASYEILEWKTADVDVSINGRRYLMVNQTEYVMNNVHTLQIPFSSSHNAKIVSCYVNYFRYNDIWGTDSNTNGTHNLKEFDNWLDAAEAQLKSKDNDGPISASIESQTSFKTDTKTTRIPGGFLRPATIETTINDTVSLTEFPEERLYYKRRYFYDDVKGGFLYYMGHEHPKTFQTEAISCDKTLNPKVEGMTPEEKRAWELYNEKYDNIGAVYSCKIDNENGLIDFSHPLVQWKDVRKLNMYDSKTTTTTVGPNYDWFLMANVKTVTNTTTNKYKSELMYYVPELNPRTGNLWDEFSRCEIIIKIRHEDWDKDDGLYEETIYITQYPAMYVEVSHDYGDIYKSSSSRGNQYVLINGNKTEYVGSKSYNNPDGDNYGTATEWWEVTGRVTYFGEVNNNPNMYVIHTSQLSEENEIMYDLGDPRTLHYNNNLSDGSFPVKSDTKAESGGWSSSRPKETYGTQWQYDNYTIAIADGTRLETGGTGKLTYYYPTDETDEKDPGTKANFIAPSFRIASSLGKVSLSFASDHGEEWPALKGVSRAQARRRCAAYQEAGKPAGRWRVPTLAEIKYLVQLSADGKIPHLFGLQEDLDMYIPYWSANGIVCVRLRDADVTVMEETELDTAPAVRCIYDEWYWDKIDEDHNSSLKPLTNTFYWGDMPKDNTQTQRLLRSSIKRK